MNRQVRAFVVGGTGVGSCHNLAQPNGCNVGAAGIEALTALMEPEENLCAGLDIEDAMKRMRRDILRDAVQRLQLGEYSDGIEALRSVGAELESLLIATGNPVLAERARDILCQVDCLVAELSAPSRETIECGEILVCTELDVQKALLAAKNGAAAVIATKYSPLSHAAIILRNAGIPLAYGLDSLDAFVDGRMVCVYGAGQCVLLDCDAAALREPVEKAVVGLEQIRLKDGSMFSLKLNAMGSFEGMPEGVAIGLLRTEFLYMQSASIPDEERLLAEYAALLNQRSELTVRLPDIGGDKTVDAFSVAASENPAMGVRGVRLLLRHRDMLHTQLRAILRSTVAGRIRILVPMVTRACEVELVRQELCACVAELAREGVPLGQEPELGAMIETPAAALCADELAQVCDFAALGTNDLIQFIMAADRSCEALSSLNSWNQPAVLSLLLHVLEAFKLRGKAICVCGEMAADADGIQTLVQMGFREASVALGMHAGVAEIIKSL